MRIYFHVSFWPNSSIHFTHHFERQLSNILQQNFAFLLVVEFANSKFQLRMALKGGGKLGGKWRFDYGDAGRSCLHVESMPAAMMASMDIMDRDGDYCLPGASRKNLLPYVAVCLPFTPLDFCQYEC